MVINFNYPVSLCASDSSIIQASNRGYCDVRSGTALSSVSLKSLDSTFSLNTYMSIRNYIPGSFELTFQAPLNLLLENFANLVHVTFNSVTSPKSNEVLITIQVFKIISLFIRSC